MLVAFRSPVKFSKSVLAVWNFVKSLKLYYKNNFWQSLRITQNERFVKGTIVGGQNNLFYKWTTSSFSWQRLFNCSWCSVNFDSFYTSLPNDRALVPLFWTKLHLSIKYQTDTPAYVRTYVTLAQRHCACVRESLPYFPSTFSSPEPTILLACGRDRELWFGPTPEVRDSRTYCQI